MTGTTTRMPGEEDLDVAGPWACDACGSPVAEHGAYCPGCGAPFGREGLVPGLIRRNLGAALLSSLVLGIAIGVAAVRMVPHWEIRRLERYTAHLPVYANVEEITVRVPRSLYPSVEKGIRRFEQAAPGHFSFVLQYVRGIQQFEGVPDESYEGVAFIDIATRTVYLVPPVHLDAHDPFGLIGTLAHEAMHAHLAVQEGHVDAPHESDVFLAEQIACERFAQEAMRAAGATEAMIEESMSRTESMVSALEGRAPIPRTPTIAETSHGDGIPGWGVGMGDTSFPLPRGTPRP